MVQIVKFPSSVPVSRYFLHENTRRKIISFYLSYPGDTRNEFLKRREQAERQNQLNEMARAIDHRVEVQRGISDLQEKYIY